MTTPRLGAPELTSGQATPETTVNEQVRYIEAGAGHFIFKDRDLAAPPGSPADGDCYLVAASPTGAWAGQAGKIAFRVNTAWAFITAIEGFTAWVNDENAFVGFDGSTWSVLASPSGVYATEAYVDAAVAAAPGTYTDEKAQDAVAAALAAGTHTNVTVTYDDATNKISLSASGGSSLATANEWAPNFTAAGDVYIPAVVAMTINQGNAAIGTGTLAFAKSTAAAPGTFSATTLPATLEAGAWLKVSASSVTGFVATHLKRTA